MNTFFFGYLSLRWRRLIRTIIIFSLFYILDFKSNFTECFIGGEPISVVCLIPSNYYDYFGMNILFIALVMLLSWILKPFVVKD